MSADETNADIASSEARLIACVFSLVLSMALGSQTDLDHSVVLVLAYRLLDASPPLLPLPQITNFSCSSLLHRHYSSRGGIDAL